MNTKSLSCFVSMTIGAADWSSSLWPPTTHNETDGHVICTLNNLCWGYKCYLVSVSKLLIDKECTFISGCGLLHLIYATSDSFYLQKISCDIKCSVYWHFPFVRTPSLLPLSPHPLPRTGSGCVTLLMWGHSKPCWVPWAGHHPHNRGRGHTIIRIGGWRHTQILLW